MADCTWSVRVLQASTVPVRAIVPSDIGCRERRNSSAANATKALLREGADRPQIPAANTHRKSLAINGHAPLGSNPPEPEAAAAVSVTM